MENLTELWLAGFFVGFGAGMMIMAFVNLRRITKLQELLAQLPRGGMGGSATVKGGNSFALGGKGGDA